MQVEDSITASAAFEVIKIPNIQGLKFENAFYKINNNWFEANYVNVETRQNVSMVFINQSTSAQIYGSVLGFTATKYKFKLKYIKL